MMECQSAAAIQCPARRSTRASESDEPVEKGSVFQEIVRRFGNSDAYEADKMKMMPGMKM